VRDVCDYGRVVHMKLTVYVSEPNLDVRFHGFSPSKVSAINLLLLRGDGQGIY